MWQANDIYVPPYRNVVKSDESPGMEPGKKQQNQQRGTIMNHNNKKLIEKRQYVQGKIIIGNLETKSGNVGKVCPNRSLKEIKKSLKTTGIFKLTLRS